jgi:hypothetical protein
MVRGCRYATVFVIRVEIGVCATQGRAGITKFHAVSVPRMMRTYG